MDDRLINEPAAMTMAQTGKIARLYPAFWRWHFLAALIVIPFVLWQSTTGTLYLWSEWWMDVRHPELRFVHEGSTQALPSAQIAAALAALPATAAPTLHLHSHATSPPGREELAAREQTGAAGSGRPILDLLLPDSPKRSTILLIQSDSGLNEAAGAACREA
jgi:PepSY-associated TM region